MNAGSTITSRDSHEVRHIAAARHARAGRPRWRNDDAEADDEQDDRHQQAGANERRRAIGTPASSAIASSDDEPLRGARRGREDDDRERRIHRRGRSPTAIARLAPARRRAPRERQRRRCAGDRGDAPRQVLVRRPRLPFRHQRIAAALADRARDLRVRILDVAEQARAGRARLDARRLAVVGATAPRPRCDRRRACTWSSPGAPRRSRARRTGTPTRSTCSRCTCRSRPGRCRRSFACSSRRSGRPERTAGPRSAGSSSGSGSSRCRGRRRPRRSGRG